VIEAYLGRAILVGLRIGALMTFAPFFSNAALPIRIKAVLTVLLVLLLLPVYAAGSMAQPAEGIASWTAAALAEIALGWMIGFAIQFVFDGMILAGQIIGFQFGFSLVNVLDPNSQVEITVISTFHELIALLIFLQMGVHRWLLRVMDASFQMIPLGGLSHMPVNGGMLLRLAGAMWLIGAEVAFPVIVATLVVDLTIGFVTKASPQFPALFFGISVKVLLGLAVLFGAVAYWPAILERHFYHALTHLESLLAIAR